MIRRAFIFRRPMYLTNRAIAARTRCWGLWACISLQRRNPRRNGYGQPSSMSRMPPTEARHPPGHISNCLRRRMPVPANSLAACRCEPKCLAAPALGPRERRGQLCAVQVETFSAGIYAAANGQHGTQKLIQKAIARHQPCLGLGELHAGRHAIPATTQ